MTVDAPISLAESTTCRLGESPVWDPIRECLHWVDIERGLVFVGRLDARGCVESAERVQFLGKVSALAVASSGSWVVAREDVLVSRGLDGGTRDLVRLVPPSSRRTTNDGKPDPSGRFVIGTRSSEREDPDGTLVRLENDGALTTLDNDLALSNGLGWSPDGTTMYSVDSLRRLVFARPYDPISGATGDRRVLIRFERGYPDGMCVDADGHLWIAVWGLGEVRRYSSLGRLERSISVPAPHVSSVAFAGPRLDTLVITSATKDLTRDQSARFPLSGMLFSAQPGVRGQPVALWNGIHPKTKETT